MGALYARSPLTWRLQGSNRQALDQWLLQDQPLCFAVRPSPLTLSPHDHTLDSFLPPASSPLPDHRAALPSHRLTPLYPSIADVPFATKPSHAMWAQSWAPPFSCIVSLLPANARRHSQRLGQGEPASEHGVSALGRSSLGCLLVFPAWYGVVPGSSWRSLPTRLRRGLDM